MQNFELKIKEATGSKTMKVGFNKVFGYYIEVSKGQANSVPDYFVRKQTLVNAERFIVPELKEYENKILGAKEKIQSLEYYLFDELRSLIRTQISEIQATARAIGTLDVLNGLAIAAYKYNYVRPELNNQGEIKITDGRHPVVERLLEKEIFVPNNVNLNNITSRRHSTSVTAHASTRVTTSTNTSPSARTWPWHAGQTAAPTWPVTEASPSPP